MTAILYTWPPDYLLGAAAARILRRGGVRPILATDVGGPALACEHAEVVRTRFDRRGNLNGKEFILGHLRLMLELASGDYVMKVDCDTAVLDPAALLAGRDETAVGIYSPIMDGMQGCCYALRVADLPSMIQEAERLDPLQAWPEDRTIGEIAARVGKVHLPDFNRDPNLYAGWRAGDTPEKFHGKAVVNFGAEHSKPVVLAGLKSFL